MKRVPFMSIQAQTPTPMKATSRSRCAARPRPAASRSGPSRCGRNFNLRREAK
jgi:hypothetical protein